MSIMFRYCNVKVSWALLAGLSLICLFSAEARQLDIESPLQLQGPGRRLLATRNVNGKVTWADTFQPIVGATVKAYDNDVIGRDFMGQTTTNANGGYVLTYTVKDWDGCCFGAKRPDIIIEVWINGRLYWKGAETSNVNSNLVRNPSVQRYIAKGTLMYHETCAGAVAASATLKDADPILNADDVMGFGTTTSTGAYTIYAPKSDGGSAWDILNGNPDPYVEFKGIFGLVGKTATKDNVGSNALNYGTVTLWRGDTNSSAKVIQKSFPGASKRDYIYVTEYNHCNPKRMVVTITLDIGKAVFSAPANSQVPRLKTLLKQGIRENWSRTGPRALNIAGKGLYDVYVNVVEGSNGYPVSLKWASKVQQDCERSNNPGIPVLSLDLTLWYNAGCQKFADPVNWQANADAQYKETAGHEWGHTVLQHAVNLLYSWTHKGSTTIFQNPSDIATFFPESGDIDIMLYYKDRVAPPYARTFAVDKDVRRLIALGKKTYSKYCGGCPT